MRLMAAAALAVSLTVAAQTPAPTQTAPPVQAVGPAKPKAPAVQASEKPHPGTVAKPVASGSAVKPATTVAAKPATNSASANGSPHAAVHRVAVHPVAAKPGNSSAHAAKPAAPVAPTPPAAVAVAPPTPAPFSQNPIMQLHGNARAMLVFAPDTTNAAFKEQYALLGDHVGDLSDRDVVLMAIVTLHKGTDDVYAGENLPSGTYRDQLAARQKFGVKYNEFVVILVDENESEIFRSSTPMTMEQLDGLLGGPTADHLKK